MSAPAIDDVHGPLEPAVSNNVHGLMHDAALLASLPILQSRCAPHQPIRALSASQFARLHLDFLTTHAPDSVLFPFLHGLEGDNDAQNAFFSSSPQAHAVPRFRGLVWVACDEDSYSPAPSSSSTPPSPDIDTDDDLDDDDYSSTSSLESLGPADMDVDVTVPMDLDPSVSGLEGSDCPPSKLSKSPPSLTPPPLLPHHAHSRHQSLSPPALLTSSFRARELLQQRHHEDGSVSYAFVEPRVPEGISLRNFGIQAVSRASARFSFHLCPCHPFPAVWHRRL